MLAVYLFRATFGAHHQEGLVMTLTASSSSRAVTNSPVVVALDYHNRDDALAFVDKNRPTRLSSEGRQRDVYIVWATVCARTSTAWF